MIIELTTQHLILKEPSNDDCQQIIDFEKRNQDHLAPWESTGSNVSVEDKIAAWTKDSQEKRAIRFLIRKKESPDIVIGFVNFTQIFYGAFKACYLGYKIDFQYQGKGLMQEALKCAIDFMFEKQDLHRIMANYMPANIRSGKVLAKLGFLIEGYAKNYLLINNTWEDHILTALSREQWEIRHRCHR